MPKNPWCGKRPKATSSRTGQPVGRLGTLRQHGQLPGDLPRGQAVDGLAVEIDRPAPRLHQPGQPLEQGRFAGAVGADQGGDLPRRNRQAQVPRTTVVAVVGQREVFGASWTMVQPLVVASK